MKRYADFKMKYVVKDDQFVLIPLTMGHDSCNLYNPTSAGFINFVIEQDECGNEYLKAVCYGESVSLRLKSREVEDSELITKRIKSSY